MQDSAGQPATSRRRRFIALLGTALVATAASTLPVPARAQAQFPSKPIRLVVPYPPGGTVDVTMRVISQRLGDVLGQPIVIDNKPGGNTTIGGDLVAKASPDGHTLLAVPSAHVINPSTMASMSFDPVKDFTPITIVGTLPLVIVAGPDQPFKTLPELIAYAKARPGQLSIGHTDASTLLFGEMFNSAAGLDIKPIAYKGGAPMLVDVMGGHIHLGATGAGTAYSNYKAGKIRVLAVSEARRAVSMPEIPTITEGGVPGFDVQVWIAVLGPAGMPAPVVARLNAELRKVLAEPAVAARLVEVGTIPKGSTPAETAATLKSDTEMWSAAARKAGLKPQ